MALQAIQRPKRNGAQGRHNGRIQQADGAGEERTAPGDFGGKGRPVRSRHPPGIAEHRVGDEDLGALEAHRVQQDVEGLAGGIPREGHARAVRASSAGRLGHEQHPRPQTAVAQGEHGGPTRHAWAETARGSLGGKLRESRADAVRALPSELHSPDPSPHAASTVQHPVRHRPRAREPLSRAGAPGRFQIVVPAGAAGLQSLRAWWTPGSGPWSTSAPASTREAPTRWIASPPRPNGRPLSCASAAGGRAGPASQSAVGSHSTPARRTWRCAWRRPPSPRGREAFSAPSRRARGRRTGAEFLAAGHAPACG